MESSLEYREPPATEQWRVGSYTVGIPPLPAEASTSSTTVQPGQELDIEGSGFLEEETIATWWTGPDESVHSGPELEANADGEIIAESVDIPEDAADGRWVLTLAGNQSQRQAFVTVEVAP